MPGKYKQFSDLGQPSRLANFAAPLVVSLLLAGFAFAPALAADDDPTGSSNSTNGLSFTPGQSKAPDEPAPDLALATGDDDKNRDKADKADGAQIAQGSIRPASRKPLPGVVGTVKIRRPFKLFAQASNKEILIHNLTFRETPVREVISELARRGNLNIIIDKSCQGKITGELRDVTLDEAMDSVLAAAALTSRTLDNSTVVVASTQAMVQLGLNRPVARAFKLSYAHPFDVAGLLNASVFNRGYLPDFKSQTKRHTQVENVEEAASEKEGQAQGSDLRGPTAEKYGGKNNDKDAQNYETDSTQTYS
ncbi:MAG: hypothetical protein KA794_17895, partial [Candidatus Obscuribacter sp.]|nr:hypothetical protein [Candidatus Obscuribacter sp.]